MGNARNAASLAMTAVMAASAGDAFAGGFQIGVQSGSATGNAVAGGAAVAEDASVIWSNPAGMMHLKQSRQLTSALHVFKPSFKFQNTGSTGAFAAGGTGEGGDGGDWAYVPNAFFTMPINDRLRFGVAINAPFGLSTQYEQGWRGQLIALKSKIQTVNLNPAIAYRVNDMLSVGAGVSAQKIKAQLSSFSGVAALGNVDLDADDIGFGFNVGAIVQATPVTRFGASYRSKIKYSLDGRANFTGPAGAAFSGDVTADLTVPEHASLSVFHEMGRWELMADVTWTGWDRLQQLTIVRTTTSAGGAAGTTFTSLPFLWDDTWRFGVGANYRVSDRMKVRMGVALDETPTNDATRSPRLPDQDRTWVAVGLQYRMPGSGMWSSARAGVLEIGYAHEFIKDATVNNALGASNLIGRFEAKANILSLQYSHPF
ncbi:MAG TPA: outer membrane protein transport protein [Burkholderiales bacterium]|nr:outer membrane protein transport protein [Burkholderiales bacterium]